MLSRMKTVRYLLGLILFFVTTMNTYAFEEDTFDTGGKPLKFTFIKHGSLLIEYDRIHIYLDPVSDYADYSKLPKADYIFITHEHADHCDPKAIDALEKTGTKLYLNAAAYEKVKKGTVVKNGEEIKVRKAENDTGNPLFSVEVVPAYNITVGREQYHPKGVGNGYVFSFGNKRVYVAGDTEAIPEMTELKNVAIAFLPVNQPYTMTPEQAAKAARMFNPKILYPYHYGNTKIAEVKALLADDKSIEVRVREMQ